MEEKIIQKLIPSNITVDKDFPLFFPVSKTYNLEIKVFASNSLYEINEKVKKFMKSRNRKNYFYSSLFNDTIDSYDIFEYMYNTNSITFLHLCCEEELKQAYGVDNNAIKTMKTLIPDFDIKLVKNEFNSEMKKFKKIMDKFKIKNNIEIPESPRFNKIFWRRKDQGKSVSYLYIDSDIIIDKEIDDDNYEIIFLNKIKRLHIRHYSDVIEVSKNPDDFII